MMKTRSARLFSQELSGERGESTHYKSVKDPTQMGCWKSLVRGSPFKPPIFTGLSFLFREVVRVYMCMTG